MADQEIGKGGPTDCPLEQNEAGDTLPGRLDTTPGAVMYEPDDEWDPTGYYRRKAERHANDGVGCFLVFAAFVGLAGAWAALQALRVWLT